MSDLDRLEKIVWQVPTPAYLYFLDQMRTGLHTVQSSLPHQARLFYSLKANPHPALVKCAASCDAGLEISSNGEAETAKNNGTPVLMTGPGKSEHEYFSAIASGVRDFSIESRRDWENLKKATLHSRTQTRYLIRVNSVDSAASSLKMSGRPSQFGIPAAEIPAMRDILAGDGHANFEGFHFFQGSNFKSEADLIDSIVSSVRTARRLSDLSGVAPSTLDLGGGFPSRFGEPDELLWSPPKVRKAIEAALDATFPGWRQGKPALWFESGRAIVNRAGYFVTSVREVKNTGATQVAIVDSGIHHLTGLSSAGRLLPPAFKPTALQAPQSALAPSPFSGPVVGLLCTPADTLCRDAKFDILGEGDRLLFPNVGAYGLTASPFGFLGHQTPAEVVLEGQSVLEATRIASVREKIDDWIALDR